MSYEKDVEKRNTFLEERIEFLDDYIDQLKRTADIDRETINMQHGTAEYYFAAIFHAFMEYIDDDDINAFYNDLQNRILEHLERPKTKMGHDSWTEVRQISEMFRQEVLTRKTVIEEKYDEIRK